ncbi:uncharacterized protein N7482_003330 [Penicillium canariense]|uniref:RNA polymerase I specific transcription initiation factor RRN3 superfamily n=1 Tax=Penicillium canariense TaxID=189055 RepID=A0A9W9I4G3_9EURO|nr:uncharacterized protein N7482_003330 [Penicillium canariense]KAJ5167736.1 hypothetical protein N7482_003330 [Penicillium canariense]
MVSVATVSQPSALTATPYFHQSKMIPSSSPVSILKTSKPTGTKRKMADVDFSLSPVSSVSDTFEDAPPSKKRARVTFDENIQTHSWNQNDPASKSGISLAMVREEVRRAIHRHVSSGESETYDQIKEIFTADPKKAGDSLYSYDIPTHTSLKHHLMGLLSHIASLDRNCSSLVHAVLESEWLGRDEPYVKLFIRFLGNLAAAQGTYLGVIFKMLVSKLAGVPRGTGRLPGYPVVHVSEIYTRVHMALRHITRLIPAGSGTLSPVLSHMFPFEADPAKSYIAYTRNLLQIINYAPELQSDILALITEKLVKIDVQIQVDLEDFEDELGEDLLHGVSTDADEELDDDDVSITSEDEADDDRRVTEIKENIHKVDGMIDILFEYYNSSFTTGTLADKIGSLDLLMSHFQTIILPTYRSRHSQFLLFHFSQSHPDLLDHFTGCFTELVFNKLQPGIMRQSAAAYLASFVARGAHISSALVRDVFNLLTAQLEAMHHDYEATCRGPDLRRYGSFYSTAQAVLYIFCFRWRDLTTASIEGDSPEQVDELEPGQIAFPPAIKDMLHKVIYSRLNPLKICSPGIVTEFARIANHFQLLYVYPLLETNKRLRVTAFRNISSLANPGFAQVEREIRAGDHLGYQLDAYFPFDPYQLPRSRRWLEGDYVEWRGIPGLDTGDDDSDSGADDDGDEDDDAATATDEE